jgi:hypothetical protein
MQKECEKIRMREQMKEELSECRKIGRTKRIA